jgi:hypothetical protein
MCVRRRGGMLPAACCPLHGARRILQAALLRLDLRLEAEQREALKLKLSERKRQLTVRPSALPGSTPPVLGRGFHPPLTPPCFAFPLQCASRIL